MKPQKLIFASDFAPIRRFAPLMKENPAAVYGDLLPVLRSADYSIVNLESPLCGGDDFITKSGAVFTGEPEHIHSLTAAGFKAAIIANNHTFDCGVAGFRETCRILEKNHIVPIGAGDNLHDARASLGLGLNNIKIGVFAISEGEDMMGAAPDSPGVCPWEVDELAKRIREARDSYDLIIISAHCGLEYQPFPSFYVYEAFEKWAAAGADIIIGHHPHVPQGMTMFGKTPAYFSLGNFVFYQPNNLLHRKTGYFLELELDSTGIRSHRPIPYRITNDGLRLLTAAENTDFAALFAKLSAPLATREGAKAAWHAVLAYNGIAGFKAELEKILQTLQSDPAKGAAMLRNRVTCVQHSTQWIDGMSRIMDNTIADAPEDLIAIVREFMTREI